MLMSDRYYYQMFAGLQQSAEPLLDADRHRPSAHDAEPTDLPERAGEVPLARTVRPEDDGDRRSRAAVLLDHRRDADVGASEDAGDARQHARPVERHEAEVILALQGVERPDGQ